MAAGQSKLLRPALYLAINAFCLSLPISLPLVFSTSSPPSTLIGPFRKESEQDEKALQRGGKKAERENNTETNVVCRDGQKWRKNVSREMGKRAMEH